MNKTKAGIINRIKQVAVITLAALILCLNTVTPTNADTGGETFPITAISQTGGGNGQVVIDWSGYVNNLGQPLWVDKVFKIYKSTDGGSTYESIGLDYSYITADNPIKVLQIYPIADAQNQLKTWMETNGYGKGLMTVDSVYIDTFNANPNSYLKDTSGNWKYDVLFFGTWDWNGGKDLNVNSKNSVESFIKAGKGVIFGHDTLRNSSQDISANKGHPYFMQLANYVNIQTINQDSITNKTTKIKIINKGLFTTYPYYIGEIGSILTIPEAHNAFQQAKGNIWLQFVGSTGYPSTGGNLNFYLTTYNNCAMIQTGHSNGAASDDERKILANLIFYTNQLIANRYDDKDSSAIDYEKPNTPTATQVENGYKPSATDKGSSYKYYVEAYNKDDTTETGKLATSNVASVDSTTGVSKYIYKYSDEDSFIISADSITNENGLTINDTNGTVIGKNDIIPFQAKKYLHIAAIDEAGNLSETSTINSERFTISTSVSGDGTITPTMNNVAKGKDKTISINCSSSKFIKSVKIDGNTVYSYNNDQPYLDTYSYDFNNIQASHTVTAEFGTKQYLVATTIENGTIDGHSFVEHGQNIIIRFSPNDKYELSSIKVNDVDASASPGCIVSGDSIKLQNITENKVINVKCTAIPYYNVHATIENGEITTSNDASYIRGSDAVVKFTIKDGYKLKSIKVNGEDVSAGAENTISIKEIRENKNIEIKCTERQYIANFKDPSLSDDKHIKVITYKDTFGELPTPKREGYNFMGWVLEGKLVKADDIYTYTKDIDLYPRWEEIVPIKTGDQTRLVLFVWILVVSYIALLITRKTLKQSRK